MTYIIEKHDNDHHLVMAKKIRTESPKATTQWEILKNTISIDKKAILALQKWTILKVAIVSGKTKFKQTLSVHAGSQ